MQKHFVEFISPGTFFAETSMKEVESWDVAAAQAMAADIRERHNAKPHSFRFITRSRGPNDLDAKVTATSPIYYLSGGVVLTLADVKGRNDPEDRILISNMECNGYDRIIETSVGNWKSTLPLRTGDVVL